MRNHYKGRLQTIEEELAVRETSREEAGRRESRSLCTVKGSAQQTEG